MVKQSGTDLGSIRARQVPQSIRFLRNLDVPATRLALIFGESAANIRQIDRRSYKDQPSTPAPPIIGRDNLQLLKLSPDDRRAEAQRQIQGLRLRSKQDLDQVEATVWAIFQNHNSVGMEEGYNALLSMLPGVANARHGQALRARLLIEEKLAWFALPLHRIELALWHARLAMRLAVTAFRESAGEKGYLLRYGEAALVASICLQKMHRPRQAFGYIRAADEANIAIGQLPGSEHLRQRGASYIQIGLEYDDDAKRVLARTPERMQRKNEANHPVDLDMSGLRQQTFLNPRWGWEKSLVLVDDVRAAYGEGSMQYAVAAKSAAAVGLKLATKETTEISLRLLDAISPVATHGVRNILSITPELKLSPDALDAWLRFAMNETPLPPRK